MCSLRVQTLKEGLISVGLKILYSMTTCMHSVSTWCVCVCVCACVCVFVCTRVQRVCVCVCICVHTRTECVCVRVIGGVVFVKGVCCSSEHSYSQLCVCSRASCANQPFYSLPLSLSLSISLSLSLSLSLYPSLSL